MAAVLGYTSPVHAAIIAAHWVSPGSCQTNNSRGQTPPETPATGKHFMALVHHERAFRGC